VKVAKVSSLKVKNIKSKKLKVTFKKISGAISFGDFPLIRDTDTS
jgi:hypothetical protein